MLPESGGEMHEYLIVPTEEAVTKTSYLAVHHARARIIFDILGWLYSLLWQALVAGSWLLSNV